MSASRRRQDANPDDVAAKVRADGGIADSQMVGDTAAAVQWMRAQPSHNGKVGLFGSCSGGRHAFIYACQKKDVDACVDLWGGRVVMAKEELNAKTPVAPIDMTKDLQCPLLGLFGNDDRAPSPEQVEPARGRAQEARQELRVPPLRRRRPRLLLLAPAALPARAGDGWLEQGVRLLRQAPRRSRRRAHVHLDHRDRRRRRHGQARRRMVPADPGGGRL